MSLIQGGTIHPSDKSDGILYPSTPRYKILATAQERVKLILAGLTGKEIGALYIQLNRYTVVGVNWMEV